MHFGPELQQRGWLWIHPHRRGLRQEGKVVASGWLVLSGLQWGTFKLAKGAALEFPSPLAGEG
jgi:hypothetical protein